jgi:CheY-like chemotaxis protein/HPt (histidine-containing phosphotransfer) domain-containing protein
MPGLNGLELGRKIIGDKVSQAPLVMVSAHAGNTERQEAEDVGFQGYLEKPVYPSVLFDAIMDVFGRGEKQGKMRKPLTTLGSMYKDDLRGMHVLVAEDNDTNQQIAIAILESAGIHVTIASNGREAVELANANRYDAICMDIQMPELNGYDATREIRRQSSYQEVPIIAMTAHAMKGDEEKCLRAGMDGYVSKPINQGKLFQCLRKFIKDRRTEDRQTAPDTEAAKGEHILPAELPGLCLSAALERTGISAQVFKKILLKFADRNAQKDKEMFQLLENQDLPGLAVAGHTLKGSAGNIGAEDLAEACMALEKLAKEERSFDEIHILVKEVSEALGVVLTSLANLR